MHVIIRRSLCAAVFAGGLLALGTGAANAADQSRTDPSEAVSAVQAAANPAAEHKSNGQCCLEWFASEQQCCCSGC